jgi:hypothetical protein
MIIRRPTLPALFTGNLLDVDNIVLGANVVSRTNIVWGAGTR